MKHALVIALCLLAANITLADDGQVEHAVVYASEKEFAGWPANEGFWQWGDEMLVGFNVSRFRQRDDYHNVDTDSYMWVNFARSHDGGQTWTLESHPEISIPGRFNDQDRYVRDDSYPPIAATQPCPGGLDFTAPGFALKARNSRFWVSSDRGHNWQGPYELPRFERSHIDARTNYLVLDSQTLVLFYTSTDIPRSEGEHGQAMVVRTSDGGKTFERIAWLTPDPLEGLDKSSLPAYALMPGVARLDDGTLMAAVRWRIARHKWADLVVSTDQGNTWSQRSIVFDNNNNPCSIVPLGGQRIAAVYGYRNPPYGIRAKLSEDAGQNWSREYVLRDDGREWDLGYVRAGRRSDGKITAVYYYTTQDHPAEFIARTIWTPPAQIEMEPTAATDGAHWTFEDTADRVTDRLGAAHGKAGQGVTFVGKGDPTRPDNSVAVFSGDDSQGIVLPDNAAVFKLSRDDCIFSGNFSAPLNEGPNRFLFENQHGLGGAAIFLGRQDRTYRGKLLFTVKGPGPDDDVTIMSDRRLDDNNWHSFQITVRNQQMSMTIDGQPQAQTKSYGPGTTATAPEGVPATLGHVFAGRIDDLKIMPGSNPE
ncbi:MAG: exo-alpha-sialidase [Phycisphaeraceae bacterium]|nr:exo-alpha-sialidase [Phycisphaeraceae bacterium]